MDSVNYRDWVKGKIAVAELSGFEVDRAGLPPILKEHQKDAVAWACRGGARAVFAAFGLGKTLIQLCIMREVVKRENRKVLIICPLGVKHEFVRDGKELLGIDIEYVRTDEELEGVKTDFCITNYERVRDGQLSPSKFAAVSLDEASILRGFGTKTYQEFLPLCRGVKYRFVATATPSPNEYKELIHYAGFLGVMDTGEALTRFFQRDSEKAGNLTLYPHKEREFWLWVASWALFINKPSDLGHSDDGYDLPDLRVHWHRVDINHLAKISVDRRDNQAQLFHDAARSLPDAAREKRDSIGLRVAKACEIVNREPCRNFILWHHLEAERESIGEALPDAVAIWGEQDIDVREQAVIDFSDGKIRLFATKPELSGSGCNFQRHCSAAVFVGINYQFNDFIQAIHRVYRFLQTEVVDIHIIYVDSEEEIRSVLMEKWKRHNELTETMSAILRKYGLSAEAIRSRIGRKMGIPREETAGEMFTAVNNDCVEECAMMADDSVDLICTSIPFSNHYEYSPNYNDFGHNLNNAKFFEQMDFLTPELHRVLKPGRVAAIHVKDRILFGNVTGTGMPTIDPFHMDTTYHYIRHGFQFFGMITIETDVVRENNQTYRLGWSEQCKDGSKMGVGCPEYLLLFRKLPSDTSRGYADFPVTKTKADYSRGRWQIDARAKWNSSGNRLLTGEEIAALGLEEANSIFTEQSAHTVYDYDVHVGVAVEMERRGRLPATFETFKVRARTPWVWDDVVRMRTLNGEQARKNLEKHICPLQFDIVERAINRWSNPGELVLDPFGGIMTVPYCAVRLGRRGYGVELNNSYYCDGVGYLTAIEAEMKVPTLFDIAQGE